METIHLEVLELDEAKILIHLKLSTERNFGGFINT